jgi:protein tyrosine/serine phosphatase
VHQPTESLRRRRRALRVGLLVVVAALVCLGVQHSLRNIHVVAQGELLRSAQLSELEFDQTVSRFGVRSVLNLRGARPGSDWFDAEVRASASHGVEHRDFELSAIRDVPVEQAAELVALMRRLPKPLLVHCQAGADRSGLASALYRYAVLGHPSADAAGELSVVYGHVPLLRTSAMDRSFAAFVEANPRTAPR